MKRSLALVLLLAAGCVEPAENPAETAAPPAPDAGPTLEAHRYAVRGVFIGPAYDGEAATVDHEAIPGYMDAMRMTLRLGESEDISGLREGDKIAFDLVEDDAVGPRMVNVERLPEDTMLELGQDSMATAVPEEDALPN